MNLDSCSLRQRGNGVGVQPLRLPPEEDHQVTCRAVPQPLWNFPLLHTPGTAAGTTQSHAHQLPRAPAQGHPIALGIRPRSGPPTPSLTDVPTTTTTKAPISTSMDFNMPDSDKITW